MSSVVSAKDKRVTLILVAVHFGDQNGWVLFFGSQPYIIDPYHRFKLNCFCPLAFLGSCSNPKRIGLRHIYLLPDLLFKPSQLSLKYQKIWMSWTKVQKSDSSNTLSKTKISKKRNNMLSSFHGSSSSGSLWFPCLCNQNPCMIRCNH